MDHFVFKNREQFKKILMEFKSKLDKSLKFDYLTWPGGRVGQFKSEQLTL